ncbi:major facilitator superfamily transporter [Podospora didyma]|uniref:Major facilitator superfamily transporter n=1 Tax=Podospora didyma TaxID=330526 RepID=A0AAE0U4V2_9PEZI|nr:major facilitator superfamily transporter [Podospora didyma]
MDDTHSEKQEDGCHDRTSDSDALANNQHQQPPHHSEETSQDLTNAGDDTKTVQTPKHSNINSSSVQIGGVLEPTTSQSDTHELVSPKLPAVRFLILGASLGLGLFLAMLDSSIVATSLFTIAAEFRSGADNINWVALAYTLTFLSCAVLFARISDVVGRRAAFLAAYAIFIVFSLACGFAQSLQQLIACRALQGVGGSGLYSITMIVFPELTPDEQKKFIAGIVGIVVAAAGVLGPVLGGVLTEYASWRWVFWLNGPVGGASALIFYFAWPSAEYLPHIERRAWREVDFFGSFLLIAAAVLLVFPFQNSGSEGGRWSDAVFLAPLLLGLFSLLSLFTWQYYIERRWKGRMAAAIPLVLLRNHVFTAATLSTMLTGFPYLLCVYVFPLRFQIVNGKSALDAGLMMLPMLAATALGSLAGGMINEKKNRLFETILLSCVMMIIGCGLETMASSEFAVEPKVLGFMAFIGFGFGISASASTMIAAIESPIREHASAQGLIAQVRIFGGSIGIAASSAILGVKTQKLASILPPGGVARATSGGPSPTTQEQWEAIRSIYTDAFREDMIVCCAVLAGGIVCALGVYRRNRKSMAEVFRDRYIEEAKRRRESSAKPPVVRGEERV